MKNKLIQLQYEVRRDILESTTHANSGHVVSSLSVVEILLVLYYKILNHRLNNSIAPYDTLILSKGHAAPALYSVLSKCGYFNESEFNSLRKFNSVLTGHPFKNDSIGVDVTTGSLGQGLSIGCGIALANKLDKYNNYVFVILGDGECQEGQIWESALFAAHHKINNLVAIVDRNYLQSNNYTENILSLDLEIEYFESESYKVSLANKFDSFGWRVLEADGHNLEDLEYKLKLSKSSTLKQPTIIIANTIKGYGVKSIENKTEFHSRPLKKYEIESALNELHERYKFYL